MEEKKVAQQEIMRIKEEIIRIERMALEEWNKGNPDSFLDLYSSDFTYFDPMLPKRLDGFATIQGMYETVRGKVAVDQYEIIDPEVQVTSPDNAVLTYNLRSWVAGKLWKWNCTEVYHRQADGKWKIIHNHWSITQSCGD